MRRLAVGLAFAVSMVITACADGSSTPSTTQSAATGSPTSVPEGFDRRIGVVSVADGADVTMCLWVADDATLRARGMMGASSFGDADAMVFIADAPTTGRFWMWNTLIDLSIAFFDADGSYLDAFDMTVCDATDSDDCTRYDTPTGYFTAVESRVGDRVRLGLVPGSRLTVTDRSCAAALVG